MPPKPATASSHDDAAQLLLSVASWVGSEIQLDELLQALMDRVIAAMQADRGTLYLLDPARGELFSRWAHLPELAQIRLQLGQGIAGYVAQQGEPVNVPDSRGEQRFFGDIDKLTGYETRSLLAVPLRDRAGAVFGVLQVLNRRGESRFTDEDERRFDRFAQALSSALQATSLYSELQRAREQPEAPVGYFFNRIIGESPAMRALYKAIHKVAATDATVLVTGESGVGKELFARALHVNSTRRDRPLIKVDCAALPPQLLENELFGHERGAFTGADSRVQGKFEAADGGTVFLDELGELPLSAQGRLLRVIQDRELERLGGTQTVRVNVRIVAATHRDLRGMVGKGKFREDLYYRIRVVELRVPPLRERGGEDIERLARHFLVSAARRHHVEPPPKLTAEALGELKAYRWPGNVRELENCMESAVVLAEGAVDVPHLPLASLDRLAAVTALGPGTSDPSGNPGGSQKLADVERAHVLAVLAQSGGNQTAAAYVLGIGRNTLARKLRAYGVG